MGKWGDGDSLVRGDSEEGGGVRGNKGYLQRGCREEGGVKHWGSGQTMIEKSALDLAYFLFAWLFKILVRPGL